MKRLVCLALLALLLTGCAGAAEEDTTPQTETAVTVTQAAAEETTHPTQPPETRMVFTFAGDCTLGCHTIHTPAGDGCLMTVGESYDYPFQNVRQWFENDDFTMVNLEGVLGDKGQPAGKRYAFRGPAQYTNILTRSSVEAVTIANNHTLDYGEEGSAETKGRLDKARIP